MNDLKIFRKAGRNVKASLVLFYVLFLALLVGTWFLENVDLFNTGNKDFEMKLLMCSFVQALGFFLIFWMLIAGHKSARIVFWIGFVVNLCLLYFPISCYLQNKDLLYSALAWLACLLIESVLLYNVGMYLFTNHSCKIFYDRVIEIDEDDQELYWEYQQEQEQARLKAAQQQAAARQRAQDQASSFTRATGMQQAPAGGMNTPPIPKSPTANPNVEKLQEPVKKTLSLKARLQRLAVKLGICVYGEMIIFPILVSLFSDYFASTDMKSVFATRDIFILCIASSFIWTFAIFFLYYSSAQSRKAILACFGAEILVNVWYLPKFYQYYVSAAPAYPAQVFIFFLMLDIIRYALIILVVSPVFTKSYKSNS